MLFIVIAVILVIVVDMTSSKVVQERREKRKQEKKLASKTSFNENYNTKLNLFFSSVIDNLDDFNEYLDEKNKQLDAYMKEKLKEQEICYKVRSDSLLEKVDIAIRYIKLYTRTYNNFLNDNMLSDSTCVRKKFTALYNIEPPPSNKILSREDFIKISKVDLPDKSIDLVEKYNQLAIDDQSEEAKLIRAYMSEIMKLYNAFLEALLLTDTEDTRKMFTTITKIALPLKEDRNIVSSLSYKNN